MLKAILLSFLVLCVAYLVLRWLPEVILNRVAQGLPIGYEVGDGLSDLDRKVTAFRIACVVYITLGAFLYGVVTLLAGTYLIFRLTDYYRLFTKGSQELYPARPKRAYIAAKIVFMLALVCLIVGFSALVGMNYEKLIKREGTVGLVAHRAGGIMATENTVLGVEKAVEHKCVGSEIDIHRTKDGYYVVNHDNDFARVAGVEKAPKDMTLAEVKELKVRDANTVGDGDPVATLDEMLDVVKGTGTKLFIELKGETADRQMVDDTVKMVREKDCLNDVVLISLQYDLIDYAETEYPEFETGVLFFGGLGDFAKLNCDLLILEEEMGSAANVEELKDAGKGVIVWTVNTEESMHRFLDSNIDAIITDNVELAEQVQEELDQRNDLEIIRDWVSVTFSI
jgi:glycerophosphoryl diester phosphodiesterase